MKIRVYTILMLFCISACISKVYSQDITARNGWRVPTNGTFRIFVVFAEVSDDNLTLDVSNWNKGQMPNNPDNYIDALVTDNFQSQISRFYNEASFGRLNVIGDYYPNLLQFTLNDFEAKSHYQVVFDRLKTLCNGGQLQTPRGFSFPDEFDLWNLGTYNGVAGKVKQNIPDGHVECIIIFWRVNSIVRAARSGGATYWTSYNSTAIGNKSAISTYGYVYSDDMNTWYC